MALGLFKYFKVLKEPPLSDPNGSLSKLLIVIRMKNSKLLASNGGHIVLTKDWSRYLLQRMGFVKRKANTKAKICPDDMQELKSNFLSDIAAVVQL